MFARIVSLDLKPNTHKQFSELFDKQILPVLRTQKGFKDEVLLVEPGAPRVVAISTWDTRENAEAYGSKAYADALKSLAEVLEGDPEVKTYQPLRVYRLYTKNRRWSSNSSKPIVHHNSNRRCGRPDRRVADAD